MSDGKSAQVRDLFACGAIRLRELSVYNWGSFHGLHTARIDPDGTLITGDNGAGKSTLVDGLMALLLPAGKATFNVAAAQGDRSDRSLMSYIRGSFGSAHDGGRTRILSKREGAVVTGLRAFYQADDGSQMTLAALFWITHSGNALGDLKRVYLVARRNLSLKELLNAFGDGDPRALKQYLRQDPLITPCDERFSEYQECYRRLLHMDNPNAPALLARALGLKKIDDLTSLIRDLVLEPSNVRDDARKAVDEFADLVGIHNQLLDARKQRDALADLPGVTEDLQRAEQDLQRLDAELDGLSAWFGEQCAGLWQLRIETIASALQQAKDHLERLEIQVNEAAERSEQCHADYLQAGGERIEFIKKDLQTAEAKLAEVNLKAARYQRVADELQLEGRLEETVFQDNQRRAQLAREAIGNEKAQAQDYFAAQAAKLSNAQEQQRQLLDEIGEIEARPDSNIDAKFQILRDEMAEALGLDRGKLMFIGELLDVRDDERAWQLGFSNKSRLSLLRQDVERLKQEILAFGEAVGKAREAMDSVDRRDRQWEELGKFGWADIDVPSWQNRIAGHKNDIEQLERAGGDLAAAKARWEASKAALQDLQKQKDGQIGRVSAIGKDRENAEKNRQQALKLAETGVADVLRAALLKKIGALKDAQLEDAAKIEERYRRDMEQQRGVVRGRKDRASRSAIGIMTGFRAKWEIIAADWGGDLASLPDYLAHLAQLEQEGLPALVEKFRERLNRHATQSLAGIRTRIESEREDIDERIQTINRVLERTEFRAGSYLQLGMKNEQYEHVQHFNRLLSKVMEQLTSDDHEARFAGLQQVIAILDKASNPATANTQESLRLLDPRHQLSFYAEEIGAEDGKIRDVLMSSSGKSGGEKESFAGTIVAASLAYVLTPDGSDRPVYSTVFLDEAFSNTAEAVSRRVLRIFKELHIHVNLITPYKNLNLARESASSLLIAERDGAAHESSLCEVTWQEIDERLRQQAEAFDVVLTPEA